MTKNLFLSVGLFIGVAASGTPADQPRIKAPPARISTETNRLIDYSGFLKNAAEVDALRRRHRVSETTFVFMAADPGTIVFDARSESKYQLLHVKGAKHLSLPDVTAEELAKIIPTKSTRLLIYCNNNFLNAPKALPSKAPSTSLNIYTFNTLYGYGYTNVFELAPLIDIVKTKLPFEGSEITSKQTVK